MIRSKNQPFKGGRTPLLLLDNVSAENDLGSSILAKCEYANLTGSIYDRLVHFADLTQSSADQKIIKLGNKNLSLVLSVISFLKAQKISIRVELIEKLPREGLRLLKALGVDLSTESNKVSFLSDSTEIFGENIDKGYESLYRELSEQLATEVSLIAYAGSKLEVERLFTKISSLNSNICILGIEIKNKDKNSLTTSESKEITQLDELVEVLRGPSSGLLKWVVVDESEALDMARKLILKEGVFTGLRGGGATIGLIKYLKSGNYLCDGKKAVVILPDSAVSAFSRNLTDESLIGKGIWPISAHSTKSSSYLQSQPIKNFLPYFTLMPYLDKRLTVSDCLDLFSKDYHILPIRVGVEIGGVVTKLSLMKSITHEEVTSLSSCMHFISNDFLSVPSVAPLSFLQDCLEEQTSVVILNEKQETIEVYTASMKNLFSLLQESLKQIL